MGEKILIDRKKEKGMLYRDFQSLPERHREHWAHTQGKPVQSLRKKVMEDRAEREVDISKYKLERHMLNNGASLKAVKGLENASIPDLTEQVLKMKRGEAEAQFAGSAILEGMFDLFGITQHKALERYQSQIHEIETEEGNYLAQVNKEGNVNKLTELLTKEETRKRLEDYQTKTRGQRRTLSIRQVKEDDEWT